MAASQELTFTLVVATVDRSEELRGLLDSLEAQTHRAFDLVLADQNGDDRVSRILASYPSLRARVVDAPRGLSRARNSALPHATGDVLAFPDDDCAYAPDLLQRVATAFSVTRTLDALTGRTAEPDGRTSPSWPSHRFRVGRGSVWNAGCSATLFVRRTLADKVGQFDERLGLGSGAPTGSGEEIDYLLRALDTDAWIDYDPTLVVWHPAREQDAARLRALGTRDGQSVGYLLRKHGFGTRTLLRMIARPAGGALLALARRDPAGARYHAATLLGRLRGYGEAAR